MKKVKIIPGEMSDIDVNFISLVRKGANKQKVQIYKADDESEVENAPAEDEVRNFIELVKSFFASKIEKADTKKTISFADRIAVFEVTDGLWRINDTLAQTLRDVLADDSVTDKQAAMSQAIDDYATYMKDRINKVGKKQVAKADLEFFTAEPIEKAGKAISTANMQKVKAALAALQELASFETEGGTDEVKKEELAEVIKGAVADLVKPINERLDKIEKGDEGEPAGGTLTAEVKPEDIVNVVKSAVTEAIKPIEDRLSTVEKARGVSKANGGSNDEGEPQDVEKSAGTFDGFFA